MNITIIGTGYVGATTGICLSDLGNNVCCIDVDEQKVEELKSGKLPIYEPGLEELLKKNIDLGRLTFSTDLKSCLPQTDIIFICVGTPSKENGEADLQYVEAVAKEIGQGLNECLNSYVVVVNKSTVPVGTGDLVENIIKFYYQGDFDVVSNPEFLKEGSALNDFKEPDRIVLGCDGNEKAILKMNKLYEPLNAPVLVTDLKTAELIKYASNSFLAMSISFINSISQICDSVGADVKKVSEGMRLDARIGKKAFVSAGCGFGGSCFPKDLEALIKLAQQLGISFGILEMVQLVNQKMKKTLFTKLEKYFSDFKNKKIAIWGLAFKPNTDDIRYAPSLVLIQDLLQQEGVVINVYDPVAMANLKKIYPQLNYFSKPKEAVTGADALIIVTDWNDFKQIDLNEVKLLMNGNLIIDGRNIYNPEELKSIGFIYEGIGRK